MVNEEIIGSIRFYNLMNNKLTLFYNSSLQLIKFRGIVSMILSFDQNVLLIGENNKLGIYQYSLEAKELKIDNSIDVKNFPISYSRDNNMILISDISESISVLLYDTKYKCLLTKGFDCKNYISSACTFFTDYSNCNDLKTIQELKENINSNMKKIHTLNTLNNLSTLPAIGFKGNYFFNQLPPKYNDKETGSTKLQNSRCGLFLSDWDNNLHIYVANPESTSIYNLFLEIGGIYLGSRCVDFVFNEITNDSFYLGMFDGSIHCLKFIGNEIFNKITKLENYFEENLPWTGGILPCDFKNSNCVVSYSTIKAYLLSSFTRQLSVSEDHLNENRVITIQNILEALKNKFEN